MSAEERRLQIIEAAIESLREVGYAGTSTREIAARGGFNAALISYYFGGLHPLLLAALDHSSDLRMQAYGRVVDEADSLEGLLVAARRIYRDDVEGGHITIFSEMVAASLAHPELAPELVARAEPWLAFVQGGVEKAFEGSPLLQLFPPRDIAYAVICFYLGVNLMTHLDKDTERIETLFQVASNVAPLVSPMLEQT
jgi:AcrR family transcriptional regulator